MKRHKDLLAILRHQKLRITPARRLLLQFILNRKATQISLPEIYAYIERHLPGVDRSSVYRNLELFKKLEILHELKLPRVGKRFQYIFDREVHHYFICKACGKLNKGGDALFRRIETALAAVHGFHKANLSVVFYGNCKKCPRSAG
ncbi:MAG: transcriptional repressor [Deltaproteobacteria bacterium]|nr:transcriptional repressor [Deltaproteobacteria bacterium]